MRYQTENKGEFTYLLGEFLSGETVTIVLYDLGTGTAVTLDSNSCSEIGATGWFRWSSENITTPATAKTEYLYIMTDSNGYIYSGKFIVGGYPDSNALETTSQDIKSQINGLNDISKTDVDDTITNNTKVSEIRDKVHTTWQKLPMDYMMGSSNKQPFNGEINAIKAKTDTIAWGDVQAILKLTGYKVSKSGDVITIYEADGTTVWRQYDLSDGGRVEV